MIDPDKVKIGDEYWYAAADCSDGYPSLSVITKITKDHIETEEGIEYKYHNFDVQCDIGKWNEGGAEEVFPTYLYYTKEEAMAVWKESDFYEDWLEVENRTDEEWDKYWIEEDKKEQRGQKEIKKDQKAI